MENSLLDITYVDFNARQAAIQAIESGVHSEFEVVKARINPVETQIDLREFAHDCIAKVDENREYLGRLRLARIIHHPRVHAGRRVRQGARLAFARRDALCPNCRTLPLISTRSKRE